MACGTCGSSTNPGTSACMVGPSNARAAPIRDTAPKIPGAPMTPVKLPAASVRAADASTNWQMLTILRRS